MNPVNESKTNPPPDLKVVSVEHLPEYVIGFPVYVAITVRASPNVSFNKLLFADILDLRESIGIEAVGTSGTITYKPKPFIDAESGAFGNRLGAGESRRMLTDVSPLFGENINEGEYRVTFSFVTPNKKNYPATPVRIKFRKPNDAETTLLSTAADDRNDFPNWAVWTQSPPKNSVYTGEVTPDNPLRFNLLLRRLFFGPEPLDRANPNTLNALTDVYEPERDALKAELIKIRKDQATYERIKKQTLDTNPGLHWWFQMLDTNGAYLTSFRQEPQEIELPQN